MKNLIVKRICWFILCVLIVFCSVILFGCKSSSVDEYNDIKNIIYELQKENANDLYSYSIYIVGTYHSQSNGAEHTDSFPIRLQNIVLTDNCIFETANSYNPKLWYYFDIEEIQNNEREIIWSKS
mgnify:CR=1 FL=1